MAFVAINPATAEKITEHAEWSADEIERRISGAVEAQRAWGASSVERRVRHLPVLSELLRQRKGELGHLMTSEMGKPISQATAEVEKCSWVCDYYAENAERFLEPEPADTDAATSYWTYRPLGLVLGIMPWNFPFWQVMRYAVPALCAGNGALLKHAPSVPGCALALEGLFTDAGYPQGVFTNLFVDLEATGHMIDDPRVRAVSLTGSVRAGRAVAERAGRAIKKCVLELGGSDPAIVLEDADLDLAAASCAQGRLVNSGQSCIAAKRFIVVDAVRDPFEDKVREALRSWRLGDPTQPDTGVGPLAREDLRDQLHLQVTRSVDAGAHLVMGGELPDRAGWWYPVTLLTEVRPGMPAYSEELFGPVASIIGVTDEDEAIRVANDTTFGLGASVYTADSARGERIAVERLEAGNCFVNGVVKSDPRLPFGGVRDSGYGRELSPLGIREFTNVKAVWIK